MRFPENSRVCFVGDSITHGNGYVSRIAAFYHEHFPKQNIRFFNCGICGFTTSSVLDVFDFDTASYEPTHAVVMIGVNDSGRETLTGERSPEHYAALKRRFEQYKKNLDKICEKLTRLGADITLCTPVPVDEYSKFDTPTLPGAYAMIFAYAEYVKKYASEHGYAICDTYTHFTEALWNGEVLYREDRIHPNDLGHYHLAKCILASQGFELGEYTPIPERIAEWYYKADRYRNILTGEYMLVGKYNLPIEESMGIVREKLERGGLDDFIAHIGRSYLELKPQESELRAELDVIMERLANS